MKEIVFRRKEHVERLHDNLRLLCPASGYYEEVCARAFCKLGESVNMGIEQH